MAMNQFQVPCCFSCHRENFSRTRRWMERSSSENDPAIKEEAPVTYPSCPTPIPTIPCIPSGNAWPHQLHSQVSSCSHKAAGQPHKKAFCLEQRLDKVPNTPFKILGNASEKHSPGREMERKEQAKQLTCYAQPGQQKKGLLLV